MAFENLSERLQNAIKMFRGSGKITEDDLKAPLREVRMALLEADVNFKVGRQRLCGVRHREVRGRGRAGQPDPRSADHQDRQRRTDPAFGRHTKQAHRSGQTAYSHYAGRSAGRW